MFKNGVILFLQLNPAIALRQVIKLADGNPGDIFEATVAIRITADTIGFFADLAGTIRYLWYELFP